ncbi:pilin [Vreelandella arcis]|uniref:Type IV pilus assembly protein PilA n=1 Tax=Vreelandella arcis TaxID=416873 RepID=A0A1G9YID3_9GAMM|nr:pilin [Halomonas arcis]SDN08770.1 type IV pilus assembly protein PilA [Halomonas arcis]
MQHSAQPATRNTKQGGFTLIELMIVVAIIGVLASIAVPQYQNYVGRAQVSEAISLASSAKTAVSEYYITTGNWPEDNEEAGLSAPEQISGSYVNNVSVATVGGQGGGIVVTMHGEDADVVDAIENARLVFEPQVNEDDGGNSGSVEWNCRPASSNTIPTRFLPASCRNSDDD